MDDLKAFLLSRGSQLAARYLGVGLTWVAAHSSINLKPDDTLTTAVAAAVGAGLLFIWDHVAHHFQKTNA